MLLPPHTDVTPFLTCYCYPLWLVTPSPQCTVTAAAKSLVSFAFPGMKMVQTHHDFLEPVRLPCAMYCRHSKLGQAPEIGLVRFEQKFFPPLLLPTHCCESCCWEGWRQIVGEVRTQWDWWCRDTFLMLAEYCFMAIFYIFDEVRTVWYWWCRDTFLMLAVYCFMAIFSTVLSKPKNDLMSRLASCSKHVHCGFSGCT